MKLVIDVNKSSAATRLKELADGGRNITPVIKTWGNAVAKEAKHNALAKGGHRFWGEIARSVRLRAVTSRSVEVAAEHFAAAHKHFGGEIRPKNRKYLTIPIGEAKANPGKTAAEWSIGRDLFVIRRKGAGEHGAQGVIGYEDDSGFHALFVLKKSVIQKPDPWWPEDERVAELGYREVAIWLEKL